MSQGNNSSCSSSNIPRTARDKFFKDIQYQKEKKRWSAECLLCEKPKRVFDNIGVTSNFTRHVREHHKEAFDIWLHELKELKGTSAKNQTNKITKHFQKIPTTQGSTYNTNHPRQAELSMAIVNDLIIKLGLPLSIVERPAFINFMKTVDPKFSMISRRTLSRTTIPSLYEKMQDQLKTFCSTAAFLSLAVDIWSDRRLRSFFAVTGHAIIDGAFKSYVLGFVPLWGSHSGFLLLQKYQEMINICGIKDKIIRLVTDNGSNNINAFKDLVIPGFEQYFTEDDNDDSNDEDSGVNLNDGTVSDEYEYEYPPNICSTTTNDFTTAELTQEDLVKDSFRSLLENNEVFRIPCFAHTIQLIVKDGLKETQSILSSLEKVSTIAKLSHKNTKFAEKLEMMKISIPRAVITRWNSQFLTVESILAIPTLELNEILIELKHSNLCLNVRDLAVLNEFVALLSLLAEVTTTTQRDNSPSISLVAPSILAIYFDLKNENNNIQHTTTLCNALISSLLSRFGGLLEQLEIDVNETGIEFKKKNQFYDLYKDPVFLFTPFLDGMFKLNWITESFLPDAAKERICARIKKLIFDNGVIIEYTKEASVPVDVEPVQEEQVHGAESSSPSALKRKRLFSNIHNDQKYSKKTKSIDSNNYIKEEISRYLNDRNNDNMILLKPTASNSYNTLAKLATKYLCIPTTTATVERVFSQSGFLCRAHRARMSRKTLQQLTLLKCNCET
ncbi:unnamed protein product [Rotaria sordida]|uniref:HAT C-terminal dimerisation domain-containing protein n=1 Tax=Rotaria sordida TaxID=392033 RepID=A0A814ZEQ7_9BILA|nr:unnamed protein product [Rotaria sordida]CAF1240955.1 unnamed protein product [Rotaria sordida]CAF1348432.1 unnamed protein product [Rotaria sordida]